MPRRPRGGLVPWLKDSETPLFVVDSRRVVLFFNHGCEQLTGWTAADVVGRTCEYVTEPDGSRIEALTSALCPPPQAYSGEATSAETIIVRRNGTIERRTGLYIPLVDAGGGETRLLVALLPAGSGAGESPAEPSALHAELAALRAQSRRKYGIEQVVGRSPAVRRALVQVRLAGESSANVLIEGPPGSGRSLLAQVIHQLSADRERPLVTLDCGALPVFELKRTLQRILTPQSRDEAAPPLQRPAAVHFREPAQLPRDLQQWLLETLMDESLRHAPVRFFSSTSEPLAGAVHDDRLIPDLYFRLTEFSIVIGPLRERMDDMPLLAQFFLEQDNPQRETPLAGVAPEALQRLSQYNWPGNIRELRAVIREAAAEAAGPLIQSHDLPFRFRTGLDAQHAPPRRTPRPANLTDYLRQVEEREIRRVLAECRDNRAQAARLLGLTRPKLYRRMEQLGISSDEPRAQTEPRTDEGEGTP